LLRQAELLRDELGREARAQVSIGLPFSMHRLVTAPFAAVEIKSRSAVSLRIYEGFIHHLREWMQQGLIDVAIMDFEEATSESHEHTPLIREQLLLVGPVDAGLRPDCPISAEQLGACKLILPGRPNLVRKSVDSYLKRHGQKFRRAADAETLQLCLSLVKDGLGYTVMPYCAMHEFPQVAELSSTPIKGLFITWSMYVSQARRHSAGVRTTARSLQHMMLSLVDQGKWPMAQSVLKVRN
jgi:LysR family transcriptional regulator, nitrogen assimilation regulatory protein